MSNVTPLDPKELREKAATTRAKPQPRTIPDPPSGAIAIIGGSLSANADDAEARLLAGEARIFEHGNRLVRVGEARARPGVRRATGAPVLHEIVTAWLVDELTRRVSWVKMDRRAAAWVPVNAPHNVAETILARAGAYPFPRLIGFVEAPILLPDGRLIDRPGFDAQSGLYLIDHGLDIGTIPESPTKAEALAAADRLYLAVETFPFATRADDAACLAALCQAVLRRALPAAPVIAISASTAASGKTLLANCLATLATGRSAAAMALSPKPEETEKRLDSILLDADPVVLLDNLSFALASDSLCIIATEAEKAVRVLGGSRKVTAPTNSTFILTGNNLTLLGDLARRVLMVRIDAGCERPELRPIPRDALAYMCKHRSELIRSVLILSRAYLAAGAPDVSTPPLGSFETWDLMIRRPLVWVGLADPREPSEDLREEDHEFLAMCDLFADWWRLWGERPVTAAEIIQKARAGAPRYSGGFDLENPVLGDALVTLLGDGGKAGARELGYRLRAWKGRIVAGLRLAKVPRKTETGIAWSLDRPGHKS
jgi:putative DNA primase/helicase